ncbi:hypothetical protein TNIN_122271 [Trichonephila inaurata madagascariensis]|uniref:Uncharacterized protein n=1 Tax=Trichonephila inaurata madagascariensis TaxID=2747483 RepID=A0A8X7C3N4_9ARAC|nr:hypothetical protein TNIN_122271 [Trichonephila inaurata madagascariensis]
MAHNWQRRAVRNVQFKDTAKINCIIISRNESDAITNNISSANDFEPKSDDNMVRDRKLDALRSSSTKMADSPDANVSELGCHCQMRDSIT